MIANTRVYAQMKERDRLAALGPMAAGLAHEVKNPLGAIKGAAQLLDDPAAGRAASTRRRASSSASSSRRSTASTASSARPRPTRARTRATAVPPDVNAAVRRTVQILSAEPGSEDLNVELALDPRSRASPSTRSSSARCS